MDPATTAALIAWGPPGVVISILLAAVARLWTAYTGETEGRRQDAVKFAETIERNTAALTALRDVLRERGSK